MTRQPSPEQLRIMRLVMAAQVKRDTREAMTLGIELDIAAHLIQKRAQELAADFDAAHKERDDAH